MKWLISILLIVVSLNCFGQNFKTKRLLLYTTAISLDAAGDALNNNGHKDYGHLLNAASVGTHLVIPFALKDYYSTADWKDLATDIIIYAGLRYAIFNLVYNLTAGQSWNYIGSTDFVDKAIQNQMYSTWTKGIALTFVISLNYNQK
jgi:hypothetical protein